MKKEGLEPIIESVKVLKNKIMLFVMCLLTIFSTNVSFVKAMDTDRQSEFNSMKSMLFQRVRYLKNSTVEVAKDINTKTVEFSKRTLKNLVEWVKKNPKLATVGFTVVAFGGILVGYKVLNQRNSVENENGSVEKDSVESDSAENKPIENKSGAESVIEESEVRRNLYKNFSELCKPESKVNLSERALSISPSTLYRVYPILKDRFLMGYKLNDFQLDEIRRVEMGSFGEDDFAEKCRSTISSYVGEIAGLFVKWGLLEGEVFKYWHQVLCGVKNKEFWEIKGGFDRKSLFLINNVDYIEDNVVREEIKKAFGDLQIHDELCT